jgi:hypothetical protein
MGGRIDYNMGRLMLPEERFERIERKVEFLVEEGARIDQRITVHSQQIADLGGFLLRLGHSLEDLARNTAEGFREAREQFQVFEEQIREQFRVTAEQIRATDEKLRATDERLNILIGIVERKFSG